jgi:hypothetical protein
MLAPVAVKVGAAVLAVGGVAVPVAAGGGSSSTHSVTSLATSQSVRDAWTSYNASHSASTTFSDTHRTSMSKTGLASTTDTYTESYRTCTSTRTVTVSVHHSSKGVTTSYRTRETPRNAKTKACGYTSVGAGAGGSKTKVKYTSVG